MIAEAAASPIASDAPTPAAAVNLPNVCFGAAVFASLALSKIGFRPLDEAEGDKLGKALLRVCAAYELTIGDEKVACLLDLGALGVTIMVPRIMEDMKARKARNASPTQAAANEAAADEPVAAG